jgi:hypothetical protein
MLVNFIATAASLAIVHEVYPLIEPLPGDERPAFFVANTFALWEPGVKLRMALSAPNRCCMSVLSVQNKTKLRPIFSDNSYKKQTKKNFDPFFQIASSTLFRISLGACGCASSSCRCTRPWPS